MTQRTGARGAKRTLAALATAALALGAVVATPLAANAAEVQVTDAVFDWGLNTESGGGAFFGGCNFLSAGEAGDTGSARVWTQADGFYKAADGNVSIVKDGPSGTVTPTWATKCQTATGSAAGTGAASTTNNRVQIANGTGSVDVAANTAEISWEGSFSVVYYGGLTYWSASNPTLTVNADGTGVVTATGSGYGTSMEDMSLWIPIEPREITLATLTNVDVTEDGFTIAPDYLGVAVDTSADVTPQTRTGTNWGSFPQSFVDFQELTGQSSYWYSSGGAQDPKKPATPIAVTFDATAPATAVITTQPSAQSIGLGGSATFSVVATDATGYQWQSAAVGSDVWANIADATSAELTVPGTSANAKQYRVVVSGAGGDATSNAVTLTVDVPTPTVTVSQTTGLDPAGETVTIRGTGFLPNAPATHGTRPPLAGKFTGAYVTFGRFADVWKPSAGAASSARNADRSTTKWGVSAADMAAIGGTAGGAIEIAPDGTFETTITITKEYAGAATSGNYGIYTYPGGGAAYPIFETYTPITFAIPAPAAPAAPGVALGGDGASVDVTWAAPADNGSAITGYDVTLTPASGQSSTQSVAGDVLSASFSGLTPGASYTATVVAKNAGGSSAASAASVSVAIPAVVPAVPAAPTVAPAATSATVSWAAPADGGSPLTGYSVSVYAGGQLVDTVASDGVETVVEIDGLTRATAYTATVTATNAVGSSAASDAASFTTLAELPAAPSNVSLILNAVGGNAVWTVPDDGGSPLTKQVVDLYVDGVVVKSIERSGGSSYAVLSGLTKGTTYTATVTAYNAIGSTTSVPSAPVRTLADPAAPTVTAVLDGDDAITVTWVDNDLGGGVLDQHWVGLFVGEEQVSGGTVRAAAAEQSYTFTGLTPGQTYVAKVEATTLAVGSSPLGVSAAVTVPADVPDAPGAPTLTQGADGSSITLTWSAPAADGGAAIDGYVVGVFRDGDEPVVAEVGADARSHTFAGLPAGTYIGVVAAHNSAGYSEESEYTEIDIVGPAPTTAPELLTDADLTESTFGPGRIGVTGQTVTIELGAEYANQWVGVAVNSAPVFVGWFLTDAAGAATVTLPAGLEAGEHHVVIYAADGSLIAYQAFTVAAAAPTDPVTGNPVTGGSPVAGALPATGSDATALWPALGAGMLLVGFGAFLVLRRRLARSGD